MNKKEIEQIEKLVRNDYGHPVLQLLIAEIIYKTRHNHRGNQEKRFETAMRALLGSPRKKQKEHIGRIDDEELLIHAASIKKNSKNISLNEACERAVKSKVVAGYRPPAKTFKEYKNGKKKQDKSEAIKSLEHHEKIKIKSIAKRLKRKLEKDGIDKYAQKQLKQTLERLEQEEKIEQDFLYTISLISKWLETFSKRGH